MSDFPKTVGPSVLTDRNAVGPTISKYISDRMSGKTLIFETSKYISDRMFGIIVTSDFVRKALIGPKNNTCLLSPDRPYFSATDPNLFYRQLFYPNFC